MLDGVTVDDPSSTYVDWGVDGRPRHRHPRRRRMLTGAHRGRRGLHGRAGLLPGRRLRRRRRRDRLVAPDRLPRQPRLQRRPVHPPAARHRARRGRQGGQLRRDQGQPRGRGQQGAAPELRGRHDDRREQQHRRRHDHRQLRRRSDKHPTTIGDDVKVGSDTVFVAPVTRRRRRLHRRRLDRSPKTSPRAPWASPAAIRRTSKATPTGAAARRPRRSLSGGVAGRALGPRPLVQSGAARTFVTEGIARDRQDVPCAWARTQRRLMVFAGRSNPQLGDAIAEQLGIALGPHPAQDVRQRRDLRPLRREHPRRRRVPRPVAARQAQPAASSSCSS